MDDQTRRKMQEALNASPDPPIEATRQFLQYYCADEDSMESIRCRIVRMIKINPRTIHAGLAGIEGVLATPPAEVGVLSSLVVNDAGWLLENPTDDAARDWLLDLAQILRKELRENIASP